MNVRTRLTLAFFAISVLPLAAVTGHSYYTSKQALQRTATQKADSLAAELGHRMEWVTADLERRMDRVWPMPSANDAPQMASAAPVPPGRPLSGARRGADAPRPVPTSDTMTGHVAGVLGDVAPMIESLELVPATPSPAQGRTVDGGPQAPPPPAAPAAPSASGSEQHRVAVGADGHATQVPPSRHRPSPEERARAFEQRMADLDKKLATASDQEKAAIAGHFVVQMSSVVAEALKPYAGQGKAAPSAAQLAAWSQALQDQIRRGMATPTPSTPAGTSATGSNKETPAATAPTEPNTPATPHAPPSADARRQRFAFSYPGPGQAADARARGGNAPSQAGPRREQTAPAETVKTRTVFQGSGMDTMVQRDGREIGRIRARLNYERMFGAILPMTRHDEGEIPFAIDADGHLHGPRGPERDSIKALKISAPSEGTSVRADGEWVVVTKKDKTGVTFGIARPLGDDLRELRRVSAQNFAVGFGLITLVFLGSVPLAGSMTRNLRTLMDGVRRLSAGDLSARVNVRSHDEFGQLGTMFNNMAASLSEHEKLVVQQERLQRELELCRLIQTEMLPRQPLRLGVAEINGVSIPAREVGGDFFNYFVLPGGHVALLVGDVSGKGVGAALLMANVQATLRARLPLEQDLASLADALDRDLGENTPPEVYLTLFVGILDPTSRELRYVNAGHNTQFAMRAGGGIERMSSTGMPLGLLPGHGYEERRVVLCDDDVLFFYTDGMVEMANEAGELLGAERLESMLLADRTLSVDQLLAHVEAEISAFRGKAEPSDDATMMALRISAHVA